MRYVDGDCKSLLDYFTIHLNAKIKKTVELACTSKTIFTGQTNNSDNQY